MATYAPIPQLTPEQAANQQKAQQALDQYFANHKYSGHTYKSVPKVDVIQIQRIPSPAEHREHVMNRDLRVAGFLVTLVAIGLIAWQSYRFYFGQKVSVPAAGIIDLPPNDGSGLLVDGTPVPKAPPIDNNCVAPGCEQFSSMPPAKSRLHIPPPPV